MPAIRRQGRRLVRARMSILFGCVDTWAFPRRFGARAGFRLSLIHI